MNLPPATLRLSDAEHRVIERGMTSRAPWTAHEWRQVADNLTDSLMATEERAGLYGLLLEDALRELAWRRRCIEALRAAAVVDTLLIETLLERTAA